MNMPSDVLLTSDVCQAQTPSLTLTCVASAKDQKVTVTSSTDLQKGTVITITLPNNVRNP